jgi:hypothetical protein
MPTGEEMQQWAVDAQQLYPPESQSHPSGDPGPQSPSGNTGLSLHMPTDLEIQQWASEAAQSQLTESQSHPSGGSGPHSSGVEEGASPHVPMEVDMFTQWKLGPNTVSQRLAALRFFYTQVLK